jgi:hypothetical protein
VWRAFRTLTTICCVATWLLVSDRVAADPAQDDLDDIYYEVHGLVFFRTFEKPSNVGSVNNLKTADVGLKFQIIGSVLADPEQHPPDPNHPPTKTFYVVKFYTITSPPPPELTDRLALFVTKSNNGQLFAIAQDAFDTLISQQYIRKLYRTSICDPHITFGAALSVPFKLRRHMANYNRDIVTDVTLAGYIGPKWRISHKNDYYISLVGNAGLALVPINQSTATAISGNGTTTVPAITVAAGVIFQLDSFQLGILTGRDYASGDLGKTWIYNTVQWYSFSIGYSFIGGSTGPKTANVDPAGGQR